MKMYKKSDLTLNNGLLVSKDGDIIIPDTRIVNQANELESLAQKTKYLMDQPEATPAPSLDGFERKSIKDNGNKFTAHTPLLDMKAMESMALMDEIDDVETTKRANMMLDEFKALIEFVEQEFVVDCGNELYCFDMPTLGSVLELSTKDVVSIVALACGLEENDDEDCDECDDLDCFFNPKHKNDED